MYPFKEKDYSIDRADLLADVNDEALWSDFEGRSKRWYWFLFFVLEVGLP
jgi:hypothetical protein